MKKTEACGIIIYNRGSIFFYYEISHTDADGWASFIVIRKVEVIGRKIGRQGKKR